MPTSYLTGGDPEFVILDAEDQPVPAWKFFDTQKKAKAEEAGGYGNFSFRDGFAVELNFTPGTCRGLMINAVRSALTKAKAKLPKDHRLVPMCTINLEDPKLTQKGAPVDARKFGCMPSLNAYTGEADAPNISPLTHPQRYFGAHMHISAGTYKEALTNQPAFTSNPEDVRLFIKMADKYIGLPLAYIFDAPEQYERRQFYGKAGEYRVSERATQEYDYAKRKYAPSEATLTDIEYRTPPSEMWNHQAIAGMAYGIYRWLWMTFDKRKAEWQSDQEEAIQRAINTGEGLHKDMLATVAMFYTPDILEKAKAAPEFHTFTFGKTASDGHTGWSEWVHANRMRLPTMHADAVWDGGGRISGYTAFPSFS